MRVNLKTSLLLLSLLSSTAFSAQYRGELYTLGLKKMARVRVDGKLRELTISVPQKYHKYFDKVLMNSPEYVFEFDGEIQNDKLVIENMPRVVADIEDRIGLLMKNGHDFYLDSQKVVFGRTKPIYGYQFDDQSKEYFVGKKVHTQGHLEDGVFVINAIIPADLFSASSDQTYPAVEKFYKKPLRFIVKDMPKTKNAQSLIPFRGTIRHRDNYQPVPGDHFMLVTLSGRQGDLPGPSGGHYAIGMGVVKEDMSLKGETFNFYFKGEKEVLASNTDLVSYFGHLIQGQVNYRPTFTLIGYGRTKEELLKVRDLYEAELHKVRTDSKLEITPFYNCTTTSNDSFREIGIHGNHEFFINNIFDYKFYLPMSDKAPSQTAGKLSQLRYILKRDAEHFIPRNSFESYAKAMVYHSKSMKLKKTDYIFLPQTPSARPMGGISYNNVLREGNRILKFKEARLERLANEKWAKETMENPQASANDRARAQDIVDNTVSPEEDQRQIDEILYSID